MRYEPVLLCGPFLYSPGTAGKQHVTLSRKATLLTVLVAQSPLHCTGQFANVSVVVAGVKPFLAAIQAPRQEMIWQAHLLGAVAMLGCPSATGLLLSHRCGSFSWTNVGKAAAENGA
jgi:hypothetical protein